jgi:hypothetical protein
VGFALAAYPVGVERAWISRTDAIGRTLAVLRFFWTSAQGTSADMTGHKGFYYHFLDMTRAARRPLRIVNSRYQLPAGRHARRRGVFRSRQ